MMQKIKIRCVRDKNRENRHPPLVLSAEPCEVYRRIIPKIIRTNGSIQFASQSYANHSPRTGLKRFYLSRTNVKLAILLGCLGFSHFLLTKQAIIIVPVADVYGSPDITTTHIDIECKKAIDCPRIMQLLFNELVTILKEQGDFAQVAIPHLFYITTHNKREPQHICWVNKQHLLPLHEIPDALLKLPPPITFRHPQSVLPSSRIITLKMPWYDEKSQKTYSVGTRFVLQEVNKKNYRIFFLDPTNKTIDVTQIPKKLCMEIPNQTSTQEMQHTFVSLLQEWAHLDHGFIPYVWGGCSFTHQCFHQNFKLIPGKEIPEHSHVIREQFDYFPFPGFDCAGLIARAAQCCGIPFFLRNSTTIAERLRRLSPDDAIEPGDIIWIFGHVMVVSDLHRATIIEARSHYHGYGKVQEIPLSEEFVGMDSFDKLKEVYLKQKPLERLNAQGEIVQKIDSFKILKFSSVWGN